MESVDQYRQKILQALLSAKNEEGNAVLTEKEAFYLSKEFTDQELLDGMQFNTPEEVADLLLDSGL